MSFNRRTEGFEPSDRGAVPRTPSIFELRGYGVIGNTTDSESVILGSNPSILTISCFGEFHPRIMVLPRIVTPMIGVRFPGMEPKLLLLEKD